MNKKYQKQNNKNILIQGINAVTDALKYSDMVERIIILDSIDTNKNKGVGYIKNLANKQNIKIEYKDKTTIDKNAYRGSHQGVIAFTRPFNYSSLDEVLKNTQDTKAALIVVLDHVKDSGNLGAIIRSAEAVGALCVIIPNKRSAEITPSTFKTSAGAVVNIPIIKVSNISAVIETLKQNEFWVCAASEHANQEIWDTNLKGKLAIVMGGEHEGVAQLVQKNSDMIAKLPINGKVQSLNVAQACSVFCYEWIRQNR